MKKTFALTTVLLIVMVGAFWLRNHKWSPDIQHKGIVISNWNSAMGAVDKDATNFDRQKLSFWADVWNDSTEQSYVKDVKMRLPDSLQKHVLSGDIVLSVNQSLNPNATYQVKGDLILDTKGMTKQEIVNLGNIQELRWKLGKNNIKLNNSTINRSYYERFSFGRKSTINENRAYRKKAPILFI